MDYTITELLGTKDNVYDGKDSVSFKVEGIEHRLSTLTKEKDSYVEGATIHGTITSKEKDGKTFYNFNEKKGAVSFQKGGTAPDANRLEMKIDRVLAGIATLGAEQTSMKGVMGDILRKVDPMKSDDVTFP